MQIHMSKQSPGVQDAELRYLLLPALGGKDGYCPQTTGVPKQLVPDWWVHTVLGPCSRASKEGRSFLHSRSWQLDGAMPGLGSQALSAALPAPCSIPRTIHPIPSGWHPQLLLSLFCFPVRALPSQSPLQSIILSAMLWHCPHGGQIQPLLRLAERFSRVPLRADGTMGSNNSASLPPKILLAPKMQCSLCSPRQEPCWGHSKLLHQLRAPATLQLLPTQLFQTENTSKELSRRETTSLSERGWLSILSQHPGW